MFFINIIYYVLKITQVFIDKSYAWSSIPQHCNSWDAARLLLLCYVAVEFSITGKNISLTNANLKQANLKEITNPYANTG